MQKLIPLACLVILVAGCAGSSSESAGITTESNLLKVADSIFIHYASKNKAIFYSSGKITGRNFVFQDSQTVKFAADAPVFLIEADGRQTPFVLYPGDSVLIEKAGNTTRFRSNDMVRQRELDFFKELVNTLGPIVNVANTYYIKNNVTPQVRNVLIEKKYEERMAFLNSYAKSFPISNEFTAYCSETLKCAKLNEQLSLWYPGFNKKELSSFYRDSFVTFRSFLNNSSFLHHSFFRYALMNFARYYSNDRNTKAWLFLDGFEPPQLLVVWDSVSNNFRGEVKSFLQTQIVKSLSFEKYAYPKLQKLAESIADTPYRSYLSAQLREQYEVVPPKPVFDQTLYNFQGDSVMFRDILPEDSLAVIDFWASWCVPCVQQFSYAHELERKFANKPVKFIRLSIDEHSKEWREAVTQYNVKSNSYLVKAFSNSKMISEWKINSIPRFMIFKNRKVIEAEAPYPSDGNELLNRLNTLLR